MSVTASGRPHLSVVRSLDICSTSSRRRRNSSCLRRGHLFSGRVSALIGETSYIAEVEDTLDQVQQIMTLPEGNDESLSAVGDAVKAVASDANEIAGAVERVDGGTQVVVSILATLAFVMLGVLTVGVGYLSYKNWQDDKASKNEALSQGIFPDKALGTPSEPGKPTLSKIGKGFAKKK